MNKKLKYALISITILLIIGFVGVHFIAPYAILKPPKVKDFTNPDKFNLKNEQLKIKTHDGFELDAYWIKPQEDTSKGIFIMVHGIGGCKEHFIGLAKEFSKRGIESILFDGRAHGKSGGEYCTYGFNEKKDVRQIVNIIKKYNPNLPIGIWGNSLGGAIAIQALEFEERLEFGIIESTFTELNQIVFDYKKRKLQGIGIRVFSDYALGRAGQIAGFDPTEIKPIESVKNIEQPVLIAHGDSDKNITYKYGQALHDNLESEDKTFVLIKGGGHMNMFTKGGKEYKDKLMNFIERQIGIDNQTTIY